MHSAMYERLKRLYLADRLTDAALQTAVKRGWITDEEKEEIIEAKKRLQSNFICGHIDERNICRRSYDALHRAAVPLL